MNTGYVIITAASFIVLLLLMRYLYIRSMRIRNRLRLGRVLANISHELLTPLTVISASVERLREQEPRFATDYALMELNVERMTRLLQQILEASKSQSGELKLLVSQGDVMEYIRQTALCIEPLMRKQGLDFTITCTPTSMMGWIDTDKVDKIIYNLLSNAAKYTDAPGSVTLEVHTNENYDQIVISVADTGIGISPAQRRRLFQRFHDGDYRRMKASGTGLGLALTRDLVYLHGGTIDCESEEEKGTTFTVTLPITKEQFNPAQVDHSHNIDISTPRTAIMDLPALAKQQGIHEPSPSLQRKPDENAYHILLVEDNEDLLMLMKTMMSSKYFITTATNGRKALELVKAEEPDLIVSDVMMPDMDGNEMTRQLKASEEWNHLPVILLTAKTSDESRKESMLLGADDYIAKPFRLGELELRINNLVENRRRVLRERMSAMEHEDADEQREPTADELFVAKARNCVMAHIADADFDREAFAAEMGASASTLYNRLRALTGMNVTTFIRDIRMREAKRMAESVTDLRVSDLAYRVGFKDPKYFATCFKKEFGMQPSEMLAQENGKETFGGGEKNA